MSILKILGAVLFLMAVMTFGSDIGEQLSLPGAGHLTLTAQARIGRPLTPVSVAGVARRTVRRCAVGIYNCKVPGSEFPYNLLVQAHLPLANTSQQAGYFLRREEG